MFEKLAQTIGINYLAKVCNTDLLKAVASFCLTTVFILFGDDHMAILVVFVLWIIDTLTGIVWAISQKEYKSSIGFKRGGIKLYVIGTTFVMMTLLGHYHQDLAVAPTITASFFILNESYSILENLNKLMPNPFFEAIIKIVGSAEAKIIKTLNQK